MVEPLGVRMERADSDARASVSGRDLNEDWSTLRLLGVRLVCEDSEDEDAMRAWYLALGIAACSP